MIGSNTEKPIKRKRMQSSDRITLSGIVLEKSDAWVNQVNEHFNGMIVLKRNDIICALLEDLDDKLSNQLLEKIKSEKLTDIQRAKWIYQQLKEANGKGEDVNFDNLVKTAQGGSKRKGKPLKSKVRPHSPPVKTNVDIQQKS